MKTFLPLSFSFKCMVITFLLSLNAFVFINKSNADSGVMGVYPVNENELNSTAANVLSNQETIRFPNNNGDPLISFDSNWRLIEVFPNIVYNIIPNKKIDYETYAPDNIGEKFYTLNLETSGDFQVTLTVLNVLEVDDQSMSIIESAVNGDVVGVIYISPYDLKDFSPTFRITGGNSYNVFSIPDSFAGTIIVNDASHLDYETITNYNLSVSVSNASVAKTVNVEVEVINVHDSPVIHDQKFSIDENSNIGSTVGTVLVKDIYDSELTYAICSGNENNAFTINALNGIIKVNNKVALNFEETKSYTLVVMVSGGEYDPTATVVININDVNESPVLNNQDFSIPENSIPGTFAYSVVASDPEKDFLTYKITYGNAGHAFSISETTGVIRVEGSLDYENINSYNLSISVSDEAYTQTSTVSVSIIDKNDPPVLNNQIVHVKENSPNNTDVGSALSAKDPDSTDDYLTYHIIDNTNASVFKISSDGQISVKDSEQLDYEKTQSYTLTVQVIDPGGLTDNAMITINCNNVNEPAVISAQAVEITENTANGTVVYTVVSSDPDNAYTPFTHNIYAIAGGSGISGFTISSAGVIHVSDSTLLNYESHQTLFLTVQVEDSMDSRLCASETITITLTNINDNWPVVTSQTYSVAQYSRNGVKASPNTIPLAKDADGDRLSYTIISGNTNDALIISEDGYFIINNADQFKNDIKLAYMIGIEVSDGSKTSTGTIRVNVENYTPTISPISDTTTTINTPQTINISVNDSNGDFLTLTVSSSNESIIPNNERHMKIAGESTTYTLIVEKSPEVISFTYFPLNQTGSSVLYFTVTDASGVTCTDNFNISVVENTPPEISEISDVHRYFTLWSYNVWFSISDSMNEQLTITVGSSNTYMLPVTDDVLCINQTGIFHSFTMLTSEQSFNLLITPITAGSGILSLSVIDQGGLVASSSFLFDAKPMEDSLEIISPEQGSVWKSMEPIPIKWDTKNIPGNVNIYISYQGGHSGTFEPVILETVNDGFFQWNAQKNTSEQCMLKIEPIDEPYNTVIYGLFTINRIFISHITDVITEEDVAIQKSFSISLPDAENLTVSATSSNTELLSNDDIYFNRSNSSTVALSANEYGLLTMTITPNPNQSGITVIQLFAVDSKGASDFANFTLTVNGVNDAPVLNPIHPDMPDITEDDINTTGVIIANFIKSSIADIDSNAKKGIAIYACSGNGKWQYYSDSQTLWFDINHVSINSTLLLRDSDMIRYIPDEKNGEIASCSYYAWDQTEYSEFMVVDLSDEATLGETNAFSIKTDTVSIQVLPLNDPPVLSPIHHFMPSITEEDINNNGKLIDSMVGHAISDTDSASQKGIAVFECSGNGQWQYCSSMDKCENIAPVSIHSARLITNMDSIRYVPDQKNGEIAFCRYVAWDQTYESEYAQVDLSNTSIIDETKAFSLQSDKLSITVTSVNDPPVLIPTTFQSAFSIDEDDMNNSGFNISDIVEKAEITDWDNNALSGIAVAALTGENQWQIFNQKNQVWNVIEVINDQNFLFLTPEERIRYVPDGNNGEEIFVHFYAWDQTSSTKNAVSKESAKMQINVSPVNDAPVLNACYPFMNAITEDDFTNKGMLISDFVDTSIHDVDKNSRYGIAIYETSEGLWEYYNNGWNLIGNVHEKNALLLNLARKIRYIPNGKNGEVAYVNYYAWDQTDGVDSIYADVSKRGYTTAFSTESDIISITITHLNDSPVFTDTVIEMDSINEDQIQNSGMSISDLLKNQPITDPDPDAQKGIAICESEKMDRWQYQIEETNQWKNIPDLPFDHAFLLSAKDKIRFVPDERNSENASFEFYIWDQVNGLSGTVYDITNRGGISGFSIIGATARIVVSDMNDAPTFMDTPIHPNMPDITEDDINTTGVIISSFIKSSIADVDSNANKGIAIYECSGNGKWQYYSNSQTLWLDITRVRINSSLLLRDNDMIRYIPDEKNGEFASCSYYAWDQTEYSEYMFVDLSDEAKLGESNAFSIKTDTVSIQVLPLNDPPVLSPIHPFMPSITEEDINNNGELIDSIMGQTVSDKDRAAQKGIAVFECSGNGQWQYCSSMDNCKNIAPVSMRSARLITNKDSIRYVPDQKNGEIAFCRYVAWDQTYVPEYMQVDLSNTFIIDSTKAFSLQSDRLSITVNSVNDPPVLIPMTFQSAFSVDEDDMNNSGFNISDDILEKIELSDIDNNALSGIAVFALTGKNQWQIFNQQDQIWNVIEGIDDQNLLFLKPEEKIRYVPDGKNGETISVYFYAWDQTPYTNSAVSKQSATMHVNVSSVNDAPVLKACYPFMKPITEDDLTNNGMLISDFVGSSIHDVDNDSKSGIAIYESSKGRWEYYNNGWILISHVSKINSLLLSLERRIRYVPDEKSGEVAYVNYYAWDQTDGMDSTYKDVSKQGNTTAFSMESDTVSITVTHLNDSPVFSDAADIEMDSINEDQVQNSGMCISDLLKNQPITDPDPDAQKGIAIMHLDKKDQWQYQMDKTNQWKNFPDLPIDLCLMSKIKKLLLLIFTYGIKSMVSQEMSIILPIEGALPVSARIVVLPDYLYQI